jgi:hypothetical protein
MEPDVHTAFDGMLKETRRTAKQVFADLVQQRGIYPDDVEHFLDSEAKRTGLTRPQIIATILRHAIPPAPMDQKIAALTSQLNAAKHHTNHTGGRK